MATSAGRFLIFAVALWLPAAYAANAEDARQFVQRAVQTELNADANDHTRWMFFETDRTPARNVDQWVAQAREGTLVRVVRTNGQLVPESEQRQKMDAFLHDFPARSKEKKSEQHDDQQAAEMLNLLPQAFLWTDAGTNGDLRILHFKPDPQFHPPDFEARVFTSMEGDMAVDSHQLRIASLKGRLIRDVRILGGLVATLYAGGTFDVERRETGPGIWQITETHVHIQGHALLFKNISEQEDDVKSRFRQLTGDMSLQQAEGDLLAQRQ
jgi:hypothetical protein